MLTLPPIPVKPGERVTCALSGGADSTALLLLLHAANTLPRNALGIGLSAIHINHQLRAEHSEADQSFCQQLCDRLAVPLHVLRVDPPSQSIENAARTLRYQAFTDLLQSGQSDTILTAHTLDDQAETVLMKLLRGAWLEGLSAIAPSLLLPPGRVLRPLLGTRRETLRAYLQTREQPWCEDASNTDEAFTRNRLRHTVLPLLREENPQLDQTLANLAELARDDEQYWATQTAKLLPGLLLPGKPVRGGGRAHSTAPGSATVAIEIERLRALPPAQRSRVLRAAARTLGPRLSFAETARILALTDGKPNTRIQLSQDLRAERSVRELRLSLES